MLWRGLRLFDDAKGVYYFLSFFVLNFEGIVMKNLGGGHIILTKSDAFCFLCMRNGRKWSN